MLVPAQTSFAVRCPQCGRLEITPVSRFALSGGQSVKHTCSCGAHKLTVGSKPGQVSVQLPCYLCDGLHFLYFAPKRFWEGQLKQVTCSDTELQLGVFGPQGEVELYARTGGSELDRLMGDAAFGEYFDHPEVMYQALSRVHDLAEEGNLGCVCGNHQISVDIYPEHLELLCPECGRLKSLLATSDEDLAPLERATNITLGDDQPSRRKGNKK